MFTSKERSVLALLSALGLALLLISELGAAGETPSSGFISTVAGNGEAGFSGDHGRATSAQIHYPEGIAVDLLGNVYIADTGNHRIRKVTPDGIIRTVAGTGTAGYSGDNGPAVSAQLYSPAGLTVDSAGNLYIADFNNMRIRKVTPAGFISTVAGGGSDSFGEGGLATAAGLPLPESVAVDPAGNLYLSDGGWVDQGHIHKVTPEGRISIVAGGGTEDPGDGGPATSALLSWPTGVTVDRDGNVYFAEMGGHRVRMVTSDGIINAVAGTGTHGYSGDNGLAVSAQLNQPYGVIVDSAGNLFIADVGNARVRKVTPDGLITTVAGNGIEGYNGDGFLATSAQLNVGSM